MKEPSWKTVVIVVAVLAALLVIVLSGRLTAPTVDHVVMGLLALAAALGAYVKGLMTPSPTDARMREAVALDAYVRGKTGRPPPPEVPRELPRNDEEAAMVPVVEDVPRDRGGA